MTVLGSRSKPEQDSGTLLAVQWLRPHAPNAGSLGSTPDWGAKSPHVMWRGQKKARRKTEQTSDEMISGVMRKAVGQLLLRCS